MKHSIKPYIVVAFCLLSRTVCQEEMLTDYVVKGSVEILARMNGKAYTRTCVGNAMEDGMIGILWTPGDRIGVYGSDGTHRCSVFIY